MAPDANNVWTITATFTITSSTWTVSGSLSGPVSGFDCDTGFTTTERIAYQATIERRKHGHQRTYDDAGWTSLRFNNGLPGETPFYEEFHSTQGPTAAA